MHIIHIASELSPAAKVGGLGDVIQGLSKELIKQGHTVEIILPKYDCINYSFLKNLKVHYRDLWSFEGPYSYNNTIWSAEIDGLSVRLIEPHHTRYFFHRGSIYGSADDIDRFLYFSRTAMEFLYKSHTKADILHLHDWPTSVCAVLMKDMYINLGMKPIPTVLTIHNVKHQGTCETKHLTQIGLRGESYLLPDKMQDPLNPLYLNLLKGGIEYATAVTTVSPSYEKEIKKPPLGEGLEAVLCKNQRKLSGILNGIDQEYWNPEKDTHLFKPFKAHPPFSKDDILFIQEAKAENKKELYKLLNLKYSPEKPLLSSISRLVVQKGPELIESGFRHAIDQGGQSIILGSAEPELLPLFSSLQEEYKSNPNGAVILDYNEELAHRIYAASDFFIVPSLFEPCGLTQMIALRYGTIPIVRKTGGLKDTVFEEGSQRNGFVFEKSQKADLDKAIDRAFLFWRKDRKKWNELVRSAMEKDFSWGEATKKYISLYKSLKT